MSAGIISYCNENGVKNLSLSDATNPASIRHKMNPVDTIAANINQNNTISANTTNSNDNNNSNRSICNNDNHSQWSQQDCSSSQPAINMQATTRVPAQNVVVGDEQQTAANDGCDNTSATGNTEGNTSSRETNGQNDGQAQDGQQQQQQQNNDSKEEDSKNDSSTLSTAFTISFDDNESANSKKLFGIRDSIRKFAPPKPHTIEKPRPSKADSQDNSYMSIESAPGGYAKQPFSRSGPANASCRSSGRKSDSSRHSNISESAAFLIDKMLNCKQGESLSSICLEDKSVAASKLGSQMNRNHKGGGGGGGGGGSAKKKLATRSSDDILDDDCADEVDFCEEKSDNGTYIVGADPESDAARKKIDELFGVVKAAEASIIAASASGRHPNAARSLAATVTRPSRLSDKRPLGRERQEHINRLASVRNSSRSSSSSRQEIVASLAGVGAAAAAASHKSRSGHHRHSRNSSCDRASKLPSSSGRPRRAASQSSRQSSNKELSDGDTQSSRSSLHTTDPNIDMINSSDIPAANMPSMKFNRAFALRRARLGLGEPGPPPARMTSTPTSGCLSQEPDSLNISPRRLLSNRYGQPAGGGGGQQPSNLSRTDGGRFSLRMKNAPLSSRLAGAGHGSGRALAGQQGAIIDTYVSKISSPSRAAAAAAPPPPSYHSNQTSPMHQAGASSHSHHSSITMPYQSSDELELASPSRHKGLGGGAGASRLAGHHHQSSRATTRKDHHNAEMEPAEADYYSRFNYSLNLETTENYNSSESNMRACGSASGRRAGAGSSGQLGALDCLVISAISSLSVKIRSSVCDLMVEHAKRLPAGNETRSVVEEILPQLTATNSSRPKSPTSIEEIDQSLYFDLAQTLKNLKKVEQIVDVMKLISNQIQPNSSGTSSSTHTTTNTATPSTTTTATPSRAAPTQLHYQQQATSTSNQEAGAESNTNSESNSLSPV